MTGHCALRILYLDRVLFERRGHVLGKYKITHPSVNEISMLSVERNVVSDLAYILLGRNSIDEHHPKSALLHAPLLDGC
jgi:hypothetical protein